MRIIATDIANLTDARYFAAWGVEGMAYNVDPAASNAINAAQLKEIVDWVEGPNTMIKLEGIEVPENLGEVLSSVDVKNAIVGPFIDAQLLPAFEKTYRICTLEEGWQDEDHLVLMLSTSISKISDDQRSRIEKLTQDREVFLDGNFTASDLDNINDLGFAGIILKGGEEEKVGFKSYDQLDNILEVVFDTF